MLRLVTLFLQDVRSNIYDLERLKSFESFTNSDTNKMPRLPTRAEDEEPEEEGEEEVFIDTSEEEEEEDSKNDSDSESESENQGSSDASSDVEVLEKFEKKTEKDNGKKAEVAPMITGVLTDKDHLSDQEYYSSDDEHQRNTVGDVPLKWYDDFDHIGYDLSGKPLLKSKGMDEVDKLIASKDDPYYRRTVYDEKNDESTVLTDRELVMVRRILESKFPEAGMDAEPDYIDYYTRDKFVTPLSSAPEPKRRFIPSKWERMKVLKIVRGIKEGYIKIGKPPEKKEKFYLIWGEDDLADDAETIEKRKRRGPKHIPAPKVTLPGHAESYHPPPEYLFSKEEEKEWLEADPEDRKTKFMPKDFEKLRKVPGYNDFITESFERCLDLYLCARKEKQRLNIDPESLVPKLPQPHELRPYPTTIAVTYYGHSGHVRCLDVDPLGHLLATGGSDNMVRIWEVDTGRCILTFDVTATRSIDASENTETKPIVRLAWNPQPKYRILAIAVENRVILLHVGDDVCDDSTAEATANLLRGALAENDDSEFIEGEDDETKAEPQAKEKLVQWKEFGATRDPSRLMEGAEAYTTMHMVDRHSTAVVDLTWHRKGEYLATVSETQATSRGQVMIHHTLKRQSQNPFTAKTTKGKVQKVLFHPNKPIFFLATQTHVSVFHLLRQVLLKKLSSGAKWISSMAIHPVGDNLVVGTYDRRVCWFDLDLSNKPYKTLKYHNKAVREVDFHPRYPLLATAADDGAVHVFHARVFDDLMRNPLIVPVKVLRAHAVSDGFGVFSCAFHPTQPWLFTAGADGAVHLFQNIP